MEISILMGSYQFKVCAVCLKAPHFTSFHQRSKPLQVEVQMMGLIFFNLLHYTK